MAVRFYRKRRVRASVGGKKLVREVKTQARRLTGAADPVCDIVTLETAPHVL